MKSILKNLKSTKILNGLKVGVACSGGSDSMCLLHFLNENKQDLNITLFAINVDHSIRKKSFKDSEFVKDFCLKNNIPFYYKKLDFENLKKISKSSSVEEIARKGRYDFFNELLNEKKVDKICLAHHLNDQAETVLLNIFRGSGLQGASGMKMANGDFIRPFLSLSKHKIMEYLQNNNIQYVIDETNLNTDYSRNFIRNEVLPLIKTKFENVENNIYNFSLICNEDNEYINSILPKNEIIFKENVVKLPLNLLENNLSLTNRIILECFKMLKSQKDIETKHLELIKNMLFFENGSKLKFPNNITCQKEYNYIVFYKNYENLVCEEKKFIKGEIQFSDTKILIQETSLNLEKNILKFDEDKIPTDAVWRKRQNGDIFVKFGGVKQKLKEFLIDKKIPLRLRDEIPILALNNMAYIVGNIEISDLIKLDENTKNALSIVINKNYKE